jgi:hypothetical protein
MVTGCGDVTPTIAETYRQGRNGSLVLFFLVLFLEPVGFDDWFGIQVTALTGSGVITD